MNSKILVTIVVSISAILGIYIGSTQVATQKEQNKKIPASSDEFISTSGDLINSGDIFSSGDSLILNNENISGDLSTNFENLDNNKEIENSSNIINN